MYTFYIGLVYYTLGNLEPKLRSSLKSIHLLSITKHQFVTKYGIDHILSPIVEEIKQLESVSIRVYHIHVRMFFESCYITEL